MRESLSGRKTSACFEGSIVGQGFMCEKADVQCDASVSSIFWAITANLGGECNFENSD